MLTRARSKLTVDQKASQNKQPGGHRVAKPPRAKQALRRSTRTNPTPLPSVRPSDSWTSFESISEFQANHVEDIFRTANWEFLCSDALDCHHRQSAAKGQHRTPKLTCNIKRDRFACGASNLVLEVPFSDSTYWVVRIRYQGDGPEVEKATHSEVATMRLVQERTSIPVPTVFGYDAKKGNPFGYQYMFMSALPGRRLNDWFARSVPLEYQEKVADQFADILHQLSTRLTFAKIGRIWCGENGDEGPSIMSLSVWGANEKSQLEKQLIGPFSTSLEYFYILRQSENATVLAALRERLLGDGDEEMWSVSCRVCEQALCGLVLMEQMTGPFPLKHPDLHYNSLLVDDDFNITGVIDWFGAQTVPCESFAICPEFIMPRRVPKELATSFSLFRDMTQQAWKQKDVNKKSAWSPLEVVGSRRADLINYSFTNGAPRQSIEYARIVADLLYGEEFSLEDFKKHLRTYS